AYRNLVIKCDPPIGRIEEAVFLVVPPIPAVEISLLQFGRWISAVRVKPSCSAVRVHDGKPIVMILNRRELNVAARCLGIVKDCLFPGRVTPVDFQHFLRKSLPELHIKDRILAEFAPKRLPPITGSVGGRMRGDFKSE